MFMACSMSSASAPRDSPTMMRSGRIRRVLITRSRCVIAPGAFDDSSGAFPGAPRAPAADCSSAVSSMVTMRSSSGMKRESVFSIVVLPGARAAGDHDIQPRFHAAAQKVQHAGGEGLVLEQILGGQHLLAVAPDRHHRADQRERRDHCADARAVGEAGVHDG